MFFTAMSHTRLQADGIGRVIGVQQQGGVLRRPNVAELGMLKVCHVMLLRMEFWGSTSHVEHFKSKFATTWSAQIAAMLMSMSLLSSLSSLLLCRCRCRRCRRRRRCRHCCRPRPRRPRRCCCCCCCC